MYLSFVLPNNQYIYEKLYIYLYFPFSQKKFHSIFQAPLKSLLNLYFINTYSTDKYKSHLC